MIKRFFDVSGALVLLFLFAPLLLPFLFLIWLHDGHSPFFWSERVGLRGRSFAMLKLRTMRWKADQRLSITPKGDARLTPLGIFLRQFKLDEIPQLWNVLRGDMSFVGPRPDVYEGGVSRYTEAEKTILNVKPGMVDFSSLFFSREGELLVQFEDPEAAYYSVIFPLKKQLMLFYVTHQSFLLDCQILLGVLWLPFCSAKVHPFLLRMLQRYGAPPCLVQQCNQVIQPK